MKRVRTLAGEQMKAQPATIGARNALRFPEESDEEKEDEIGIHLRLQLEVAHEIFRPDLAPAALELERGVKRVIDFLHEHDERANISVAQPRSRVMSF
jgi:hypothetical protein